MWNWIKKTAKAVGRVALNLATLPYRLTKRFIFEPAALGFQIAIAWSTLLRCHFWNVDANVFARDQRGEYLVLSSEKDVVSGKYKGWIIIKNRLAHRVSAKKLPNSVTDRVKTTIIPNAA